MARTSSGSRVAPTRPRPPSPRCSTSPTSSPRPRPGIHPSDQSVEAGTPASAERKHPFMTTLSPEILSTLEKQAIELPSWAFGNSGTRFRVFPTAGPRATLREDRGCRRGQPSHGPRPTVALHNPCDLVDDYTALAATPKDLG